MLQGNGYFPQFFENNLGFSGFRLPFFEDTGKQVRGRINEKFCERSELCRPPQPKNFSSLASRFA